MNPNTPPDNRDDRFDDEISLLDLLSILWNKKIWIVGSALLFGLIAAAVVLILPRTYETEMSLVVNTPVTSMRFVPMPVMRQMATSSSLAQELLAKVYPDEKTRPALTPFRTKSLALVQQAPENPTATSDGLTLRFRATDPATALKLANVWLDLYTTDLTKVYSGINEQSLTTYKLTSDQAQKSLSDARSALLAFQTANPIDQWQAELTHLKKYHASTTDQFHVIDQALAIADSQRTSLISTLRAEKPEITTQLSEVGGRSAAIQILNPVYQKLKDQLSDLDVATAGQKQLKPYLQTVLDESQKKIDDLTERIAKAQAQQNALTVTTAARQATADAQLKNLESAQAAVLPENFAGMVRVIDPAFLPQVAIAPARTRTVALALIAGGFLGVLAAFLSNAIDERRRLDRQSKA